MGPVAMMGRIKSYLRYSGLEVSFSINPFGWVYVPKFTKYPKYLDELYSYGDNFRGFSVAFLGFKIHLWVDDGYDFF